MLKKVSDKQKKEISELFVKGSSIKDISNIYQFSVQTITRQLKISLGDNEFKRIKYLGFSSFLLMKRLIIKITMLIFKTTLNNEPAINWIGSDPNNGFKNLPIINRK